MAVHVCGSWRFSKTTKITKMLEIVPITEMPLFSTVRARTSSVVIPYERKPLLFPSALSFEAKLVVWLSSFSRLISQLKFFTVRSAPLRCVFKENLNLYSRMKNSIYCALKTMMHPEIPEALEGQKSQLERFFFRSHRRESNKQNSETEKGSFLS